MKQLLLLMALICSGVKVSAQDFFVIHQLSDNVLLQKGVSFFEDKSASLTFEEIKDRADFIPVSTSAPNFGISNSVFWLKVNVFNATADSRFRLQLAQPSLDEVDFIQKNESGLFVSKQCGEKFVFSHREFYDPSFIFSAEIPPGKMSVFYFRLFSRDNLQVPIILGPPQKIFESNKVKDFVFGIFAGIMLVMFLYNAFLFATVRDKTYLFYIIYLATVILTQCSIQGYTFQYLWPDTPWLAQWSPFLWSPAVGIASAYFLRVFLNTRIFIPKLDLGFHAFTVLYALAFVAALTGRFSQSYLLITSCAFALSMYMLLTAVIIFRKNFKPARYFLLAWTLFLMGVTIYSLTNFGIVPITSFTQYAMPAGAAAEVILLSLALADRINVLKREKEASQAEALSISQQNQELIRQQNVLLEQKVHERTIELEETNEELNVTLSYLKDTQTQLVNAEKMASLGQLTAGIAHEINNPINFVSANLKPLRLDISEVFDIIALYEKIESSENLPENLSEIEKYKKKIDLPFLKTEITSLLSGIEEGASRTAEIVSGLRNFSRLDESDIKDANVNEGIESTLILLRSQLQDIEVSTDLGPVPSIECFPGKLNQVFMNILSNGIYAVNKMGQDWPKKLSIRSFLKNDKVHIVFHDNGIGMSQEVKEKVFEPFFTTKDVGEGTGLGMSIVFKIVESHQAKMEIESQPNAGTTITLILNQKIS
jgi:two-component system NtrC family sensor kinase